MFRIDRLYSGEVHVCVHEDVERGGGLRGRQALALASLVSDSSPVGYTL